MRGFYYRLVFVFVILLIGCKSTKLGISKSFEEPIKNISDQKLIKGLEDNRNDYNSIFVKKADANAKFGDNKLSFKAAIFIQKDSQIVISITALMGIELFRIRLTPDEIVLIDRTKKETVYTNYNYLSKKFNIDGDFYVFQGILSNNIFCYPFSDGSIDCLKKFKHGVEKHLYSFQSLKDGRLFRLGRRDDLERFVFIDFLVIPGIFKVKEMNMENFEFNSKLKVVYGDITDYDNVQFPSSLNIEGSKGNSKLEVLLEFKQIEFNKDSSISFRTSDKYKEVVFK